MALLLHKHLQDFGNRINEKIIVSNLQIYDAVQAFSDPTLTSETEITLKYRRILGGQK